jgi:radical SAM protein with 4Fe4S-binding SPASM domain
LSLFLEPSRARRLARLESVWRDISPWLLLRQEDSVLILPPNRVYKLGGSGADILAFLSKGGRLANIPGLDEARLADLELFFSELEAASAGKAVELASVPYDFSFTRLPVLGELALTYRCNEACLFCYAGCGADEGGRADEAPGAEGLCRSGPPSPDRDELSTAEAKRVIDIFKREAKIPFFSFTGGEPLLRPDLEELASYARELGLRTNLITNGSLASPGRAASLKAAGIETAQVSLESSDPAIHDGLCGRQGAWERTVAGIANLAAAGILVQTNTTITARNREGLALMPAFLSGLGVRRFSMNLFIPAGRGMGNFGLLVPYSEVGGIVDAVKAAARSAGLVFFWYSPTPYCLYNPLANGLGNKSCAALDGLLHVNPYGQILPCSSWPEALGSVLDGDFRKLWFSERAGSFKRKEFAPEACQGCQSFVACQGACPLYWKSVGSSELEATAAT